MIPILYESSELNFVSNGIGRLRDCITCTVTEERNGIYECEFQYPINGVHYEDIRPGRIIAVEHDYSGDIQPFDIVSYSRPINGIVTFTAVHVSYRLNKVVVSGTNINSLSAALTLLSTGQPSSQFFFETDFESSAYMAAADGVPRTVRSMLGGVEGSILDTYGGEYIFDQFRVMLTQARGVERDLTIRYGVNLRDYQEDVDYLESYSSVVPFWTGIDNNGNPVTVKGSRISSGDSTVSGRDEAIPLDLTDKFEEKPSVANVESMAASYLSSANPTMPAQSITVDFVNLADTIEYAELKPLLSCSLCDTVNVIFSLYNVSGKFKIVKTVYDVLAERFSELELGTLSTTLSEALGISNSLGTQSGGGGMQYQDFVISEHTPAAHSVPASAYEGWYIGAFTKAGYYPLGIVGFDMTGTGTGQCVPIKYYLTDQAIGTTRAYVGVRNNRTSATSTTFSIYVLWVKAGS